LATECKFGEVSHESDSDIEESEDEGVPTAPSGSCTGMSMVANQMFPMIATVTMMSLYMFLPENVFAKLEEKIALQEKQSKILLLQLVILCNRC